jgi:hypothetical protein
VTGPFGIDGLPDAEEAMGIDCGARNHLQANSRSSGSSWSWRAAGTSLDQTR